MNVTFVKEKGTAHHKCLCITITENSAAGSEVYSCKRCVSQTEVKGRAMVNTAEDGNSGGGKAFALKFQKLHQRFDVNYKILEDIKTGIVEVKRMSKLQ